MGGFPGTPFTTDADRSDLTTPKDAKCGVTARLPELSDPAGLGYQLAQSGGVARNVLVPTV